MIAYLMKSKIQVNEETVDYDRCVAMPKPSSPTYVLDFFCTLFVPHPAIPYFLMYVKERNLRAQEPSSAILGKGAKKWGSIIVRDLLFFFL